jgi:hypothetical protein
LPIKIQLLDIENPKSTPPNAQLSEIRICFPLLALEIFNAGGKNIHLNFDQKKKRSKLEGTVYEVHDTGYNNILLKFSLYWF